MAKKHWIYIKRGLSEDPKHRERIGQAVWAFMHIIDRADWETGTVYDWRDKDEADDMGVNVRTLREWRQQLDKQNYITCIQERHSQRILIHNWINPRDYSSKKLNPFPVVEVADDEDEVPVDEDKGDIKTAPLEIQDDTQGDTQGNRKNGTPTSNSKINSHIPGVTMRDPDPIDPDMEEVVDSANKFVDALLHQEGETVKAAKQGKAWKYRESFPENLRPLADRCAAKFGAPAKKKLVGWLVEIGDWYDRGGTVEDFDEAMRRTKGWNVKPISPYSLQNLMPTVIQERINAGEAEPVRPWKYVDGKKVYL